MALTEIVWRQTGNCPQKNLVTLKTSTSKTNIAAFSHLKKKFSTEAKHSRSSIQSETMLGSRLFIQHEIFHEKMEHFVEVRPVLRYFSVRVKRIEHITDAEAHKTTIEAVYNNIMAKSVAAKKEAGRRIVRHIRRTILEHAEDFRQGQGQLSHDHAWSNIKAKEDIHPQSNIKRFYGKQKVMMGMVASDFTAQALIKYLDAIFLEAGLIEAKDVLTDDHALLQLDRRSEKALNDLRMLKLA